MKGSATTLQAKENEWTEAVYKARWVEISIRYDDFIRFLTDYVLPFTDRLLSAKVVHSFYYNLVDECDDIIQLHFKTSQYHATRYLFPCLFETLQKYFSPSFLKKFSIMAIDSSSLERKAGYARFRWNQFKIIGIEEFSFNRFPFRKNTHGKDEISELLMASSNIITRQLLEKKENGFAGIQTEHCFSFLLPLVYSFIRTEEQQSFFEWLIATAQDLMSENAGSNRSFFSRDSFDSQNWDDDKDRLYLKRYAIFSNKAEYDLYYKDGKDIWIIHVNQFKSELDSLSKKNLLHIWQFKKDPLEAQFLGNLDAETEMRWLLVTYLVFAISGQLGIKSNEKYVLLSVLNKFIQS